MPIKPNSGEEKNDFISRCISEEVKSGYEQDQAAAICYSKWRESKKSQIAGTMKSLQKAIKQVDLRAMKTEDADSVTMVVERAAELATAAKDMLTGNPHVDYAAELDYGTRREMEKGLARRDAQAKAIKNLGGDPLFYKSVRAAIAEKQLAGQAGASLPEKVDEESESEEQDEAGVRKEGATSESHEALIPEKLVGEETDATEKPKKSKRK